MMDPMKLAAKKRAQKLKQFGPLHSEATIPPLGSMVYKTEFGEDISTLDGFPNDSECPECHYFDITNPTVKAIILKRDPEGRKNLLAQARCKCPEREKQVTIADGRRFDAATLPHGQLPKTFENFLQRAGTEDMIEAAKAFTDAGGVGYRFLTIQGEYGNGKSHILEAMARKMLKQGAHVKYTLAKDFLDKLRSTYSKRNDDDFYDVLNEYKTVYALFLDDLGAEADTVYGMQELTGLVESRLQAGARMVITTNVTREQMMETNPRLASRVFATNPALYEVRVVANFATDYRK